MQKNVVVFLFFGLWSFQEILAAGVETEDRIPVSIDFVAANHLLQLNVVLFYDFKALFQMVPNLLVLQWLISVNKPMVFICLHWSYDRPWYRNGGLLYR